MTISVVVPTHNRQPLLERCLAALAAQETDVRFEVVVVDDGSVPPVTLPAGAPAETRIVRREQAGGPAVARNAGAATATGALLAFTDDDTIPSPGWVDAIVSHFAQQGHQLGVMGATESPPYDPLTDHTIDHPRGALVTCNIAYRRDVFERAGGFNEGFPYPHCEDLDLGLRIERLGEIGFAPAMRVVHPPHRLTARQQIRRARMIGSDVMLRDLHPERFRDYRRLPVWTRPPVTLLRDRIRLARRMPARSPSRLGHWGFVTTAQVLVGFTACARYRFGGTRR